MRIQLRLCVSVITYTSLALGYLVRSLCGSYTTEEAEAQWFLEIGE